MPYLIIICDPSEVRQLYETVELSTKSDSFRRLNNGKRSFEIQTLTSMNEVTSFRFDKEVILQVFVREHLEWWKEDAHKLTGGYAAARYILEKIGDAPRFAPAIQFFSHETREELSKFRKGFELLMVRLYWHYEITKHEQIFWEEFPESKFRFYRNLCLVESQLVAQIKHDLNNTLKHPKAEIISKIDQVLHFGPQLLGQEAFEAAQNLGLILTQTTDYKTDAKFAEVSKLLLHKLEERNDFLSPPAGRKKKYPFKVLVVDDDPGSLHQLKIELGGFFESVETCSNGLDAIRKIEEMAPEGQLDVVFADLELLDENKFYQPVHGFDVLHICKTRFPQIVTKVVTALSRRGLRDLLGVEKDDILYKTGSGSLIEANDNLSELMTRLEKQVNERAKLKNLTGPRGNLFSKGYFQMYHDWARGPKKQQLEQILSEAEIKAMEFIKWYDRGSDFWIKPANKIPVGFPTPRRLGKVAQEQDEAVFRILLIHRRVMLAFAKNIGEKPFIYWSDAHNSEHLQNHPAFARNGLPRSASTYFSNLSLSKNIKSDGRVVIAEQNPQGLFPEEAKWLKTLPVYIHISDPGMSIKIYDLLIAAHANKLGNHKIFEQNKFFRKFISENPRLTVDESTQLYNAAQVLLLPDIPKTPEVRDFLTTLSKNLREVF